MKAYDIEGWLMGTKIRRTGWNKGTYMWRAGNTNFHYDNGVEAFCQEEIFTANDWEPYAPPKPKKKIVLREALVAIKYAVPEKYQIAWVSEDLEETPTFVQWLSDATREVEIES